MGCQEPESLGPATQALCNLGKSHDHLGLSFQACKVRVWLRQLGSLGSSGGKWQALTCVTEENAGQEKVFVELEEVLARGSRGDPGSRRWGTYFSVPLSPTKFWHHCSSVSKSWWQNGWPRHLGVFLGSGEGTTDVACWGQPGIGAASRGGEPQSTSWPRRGCPSTAMCSYAPGSPVSNGQKPGQLGLDLPAPTCLLAPDTQPHFRLLSYLWD